MNILDSLFGAQVPLVAKMLFAFGVIFGLIALFWFVGRRFMPGPRVGVAGGRSRQPRLGVLDAHAVDARRKLVLIRRDNVEHLIMIGGPNDVVIESTILRARPQARAQGNGAAAQPAPTIPAERIQPALVPAAEAARMADAEPRAMEADVRAMEADMAAQLEEAFRRPPQEAAEPPASVMARSTPPPTIPEPMRPARAEPAEPGRPVEPPYHADRDEMEVDLFEEDAPALRGSQWEDEADHRRDQAPVDRAPAAPYRLEPAPTMREAAPPAREMQSRDEPVRAPDPPRREPARAQTPAAPAPQRSSPSILELRIPELRLPELRLPEARRPGPPPRASEEEAMDLPPQMEVDQPRSAGRASPPPVIAVPQAGEAAERGSFERGGFDHGGDQDLPAPAARPSQIPSFTPRQRRDPRLATVPQPAQGVSHPEPEEAPPQPRQSAPVRQAAADPFASLEEEMASLLGRSPGSSNP
jgi:flagellar protein FliO/FliZ